MKITGKDQKSRSWAVSMPAARGGTIPLQDRNLWLDAKEIREDSAYKHCYREAAKAGTRSLHLGRQRSGRGSDGQGRGAGTDILA